MAWNEPGGKDPWGGGGGGSRQPPDLDQAFKDLAARYRRFFGGGESNRGLVLGVLALILVGWAVLGIYQVDAKERAVILRFGKYLGMVGDGLHWNPPLIDSVTKVRVTEERQYQTRGEMLTQDENIVELPLTVHYNVSDAKAFVLNVRDPEKSLTQATDSALRHVVGSTKLDDVVSTGREQLSVDVKNRLQTYIDNYGTGIRVVKVNILEAKPPAEVKPAYDDVIKAREDQERLVNEAQGYANGIIPETRGRAQRVIEEANAYRARVIADAEGQTRRFEQLLAEYKKAPDVTRQRLYLDTVEELMSSSSKVMVDVKGGNNMLYLPLDKLVSQQAPKQAVATDTLTAAEISSIADQVIEKLRSQTVSPPRREPRE